MYLLDTNVLSELRAGKPKQDQAVTAWAESIPAGQCYISAITVLELELGVKRLEAKSPPQGKSLRAWVNAITEQYGPRTLSFSGKSAAICASLHIPDPRSERDAMIGACAIEHRLTLATRNVKHFQGIPISIVNPWNHAG